MPLIIIYPKNRVGVKIVLLLILFLPLSFCADEAPRATIPFAPVNFLIDLNGLDHPLKSPLSYKIYTDQDRRSDEDRFGFSGLLIVSANTTETVLYAYDLCCPHEKRRDIKVIPGDNGTAACPVCGSMFVTMYGFGTVEDGPASEPLQKYRVVPFPSRAGAYRVIN